MTDRILYTIPNLDTAGSGKALANLIAHLDRSRFEPMVAVSRAADSPVARRLAELDIPVEVTATTLDPNPRVTLPLRAWRTGRALRHLDAAIWHSFHYLDDYTEPLVARAAGARWACTKKSMSWNGRAWRLRTGLAHAVIAQNSDMLRLFFARDRRKRVHLIPRGVPIPDLDTVTPAATVRRELQLPAESPLVTCVARLQDRKRQVLLMGAMADVPDAHLALAGAGDAESIAIVERAAGRKGIADRVHRLGPVDDVDGLVAASSVFCLPTAGPAAEGCPVALLEAMAVGAAVVVTDIPGSRDVVRPDVDGVVVPPDDREALTEAIGGLLADADRQATLGASARERIEAQYTIELEARRHEEVYMRMLDER